MNAKTRFMLAAVFSVSIAFSALRVSALQTNVDLDKMDPALAAQVLESQRKKEEGKPAVTIQNAKEWAGIGEDVAKAIGATAKALSMEVNEFMKTPVGKWTFILIFWYVLGHKLWMIAGGIMIWAVLGSLAWKSFKRFHMPQAVITKNKAGEDEVKYVSYEFRTSDAKIMSAVIHTIFFCVLSIAMALVILL